MQRHARWRTARRSVGYYVGGQRVRCAGIAAATVGQAGLALAPLWVVKHFVEDVQGRRTSLAHLAALLAVAAAMVLASGLVGVVKSWLVLTVRTDVMRRLRQTLSERLLRSSVTFFTQRRGGELLSRLLNDVAAVDAMFDALLSTTTAAVTLVAAAAAMTFVSWELALVTVAIVPLMLVVLRLGSRGVYGRRMLVQRRLGELSAQMQETFSLSGIMLAKSMGREDAERRRLAELNEALRRDQVAAGMASSWVSAALSLVQITGLAAFLLAGGWLVVRGSLTLSDLVAFVTVAGLRFAGSLSGLGSGAVKVVGALPAWERVFEVIDGPTTGVEVEGTVTLDEPRGGVTLEHVTFTYPGRDEPVLHDVHIEITPGQLVALVGPSGAGKTTLCNLVSRFYDPDRGTVLVDGHDLRSLTAATLGRLTGHVLQDPFLFHGTLRDNLLYARPDASEEQLWSACEDAQLLDVIDALPDGMDTVVGERGHRLSGGEKQRAAIARVILKDPPVLVLDEATAHLDSLSEERIQLALARVFRGRTSLVIAHRLSTITAADVVFVLDRGRVVQQGTHAALVREAGLYQALYRRQASGADRWRARRSAG